MLSRCQGLRPRSGLLRSPVGTWRIRDLDSPSGPRDSGKAANLLCRPTCLTLRRWSNGRRGRVGRRADMKKKNLFIASAIVAALAVPLVSSSQPGSAPQGPSALSIDRLIGLEAPEG